MQQNGRIQRINKSALARTLGVSRSSLYYRRKRPSIDADVKIQIEGVLTEHKAYGHKRIARELKMGKERIRRVMKKFNLHPYRRRGKRPRKKKDERKTARECVNVTKLLCPIAPFIVWVADFTYIRFHNSFVYLATIMDMYTREIIGWYLARVHTTALVLGAVSEALAYTNGKTAQYFHSDQGSEYDSREHAMTIQFLGMTVSMSEKASPWQNGYKESFYAHFKNDFGDPERFDMIGELVEAVALHIIYYNTRRRHSVLDMPPTEFRRKWEEDRIKMSRLAKVSKKSGT